MLRPRLASFVAASIAAALLAGCGGGPARPSKAQMARIDRVLERAPGVAQPSTIVATEIAFARMAREEGQWTAFANFAANDGVLHGTDGPFAAKPWLARQDDPAEAVQWAPRTVWMSCDATLAVSMGRYRYPAGNVGVFVTVWQRQRDGTYRWIYDGGADDDPQPAPRAEDAPGPDEIVVTAIDAVRGEVADCVPPGEGVPGPRWAPLDPQAATGGGRSNDGTLVWQWRHGPDGFRHFAAFLWRDGGWQDAADFDYARPEG